jgi:iron complex transport system ATP-binding protein
MNPPAIAAAGLSVSLGKRPVLRDVAFEVVGGRFTGLIGPNGSGKTTLLRTIGGLLPYEGTLTIDGRAVSAWPARAMARRLAFLRQSASVPFDFTVREFVSLGRIPHRSWLERERVDDRVRIDAALRDLDLEPLADSLATRLSGGEQQRLFLAQALVQDTDLLLLDEPTSHLDLFHQFDLLRRLDALVAAGKTVVAVFHDLALAALYADALLVLADGRLVASGTPAEVLTPALIASVFRMDARVTTEADRRLDIRLIQPLPP